MIRIIKSTASIILAMVITATAMPVCRFTTAALAADDSGFVVEDGVLIEYTGAGGDVVIPDDVISIGDSVFEGNSDITGVVIPESVTSILDYAFCQCKSLSSVTIPDGVRYIGDRVFEGTPWLKNYPNDFVVAGNDILIAYKGKTTDVVIPGTVKSIGPYAFFDNSLIKTVAISAGVTTIGDQAFADCENLMNVTIQDGANRIGEQAFSCCTSLSSVTIPNTVTDIGCRAFEYTPWIEDCADLFVIAGDGVLIAYKGSAATVTIPDTVKSIGGSAFEYNYDNFIRKIIVSNCVTKFCDYAFSGCINLITINIPVSVKTIGENAFCGCERLPGITIPESVTNIGLYAFSSCAAMTQINVDGGNVNYSSQDGVLFNNDKSALIQYPCAKWGDFTIPDTVKTVGPCAFYACQALSAITITGQVTNIGERAFGECEGIDTVIIPGNITVLNDGIFEACISLKSVIIQSGVISIGKNSFNYCGSLTDIIIPDTVTSIGENAFDKCTKLINFKLPVGLKNIGDNAFSNCEKLTGITLPDGLESVGREAFSYCVALDSITIPASVKKIGLSAFGYCTMLTQIAVEENNQNYASRDGVLFDKKVTSLIQYPCGRQGSYGIPDTILSINDYAFSKCKGLSGITIPSGVRLIGNHAIEGCSALTGVVIPDTVLIIGDYAFYGYNDNNEPSGLSSISIPAGVTEIGGYAFDGTAWLENKTDEFVVVGNGFLIRYNGKSTDVSIPGGVKTICEGAFSGFRLNGATVEIKNVFIPGSVTTIAESAFFYCWTLETAIICNGVKTIGDYAFEACVNLTSLYIPQSVTSIGGNAISNSNYGVDFKIYCPTGSYAQTYAIENNIPYTLYPDIEKPEGTNTVIDKEHGLVYGLSEAADSLDGSIGITGGGTLQVTKSSDTICGTGSTVSIVIDGFTIQTFKVVIFGDVNGDGNIDATDADTCIEVQNWTVGWNHSAQDYYYKAGDVNGDGNVDALDADIMTEVANWRMHIDQTTGLAVMRNG